MLIPLPLSFNKAEVLAWPRFQSAASQLVCADKLFMFHSCCFLGSSLPPVLLDLQQCLVSSGHQKREDRVGVAVLSKHRRRRPPKTPLTIHFRHWKLLHTNQCNALQEEWQNLSKLRPTRLPDSLSAKQAASFSILPLLPQPFVHKKGSTICG